MSKVASALGGARYDGFAHVREIGPLGMISLRAKPDVTGLAEAVTAVTGCPLPAQRRVELAGGNVAGWMSPDEYLLIVPYDGVKAALATLAEKLAGQHHLAVDVSDARAVFRIDDGSVVTFADVRRFGRAWLLPPGRSAARPGQRRNLPRRLNPSSALPGPDTPCGYRRGSR